MEIQNGGFENLKLSEIVISSHKLQKLEISTQKIVGIRNSVPKNYWKIVF